MSSPSYEGPFGEELTDCIECGEPNDPVNLTKIILTCEGCGQPVCDECVEAADPRDDGGDLCIRCRVRAIGEHTLKLLDRMKGSGS